LVESGQHQQVARVLVVDVPEALQLERAIQRDQSSEAQIRAILNAQASREERLRHADDVLVNDRDRTWLESEVKRLHGFYLTLRGGQE
jgi:dephospho-CoA kinase